MPPRCGARLSGSCRERLKRGFQVVAMVWPAPLVVQCPFASRQSRFIHMRTTSSSPSNNVAARRTRAPRRVTDVARHRTTTLRCVAFTNGRLGMEISAGQWVRVRVTCTGNQCQSVAPKVQQWREFNKEILYTFEKSPLKPLKTQKKIGASRRATGGAAPQTPPSDSHPRRFQRPVPGPGCLHNYS